MKGMPEGISTTFDKSSSSCVRNQSPLQAHVVLEETRYSLSARPDV